MVSITSKLFEGPNELCNWINDNDIHQSQIVAITNSRRHYTLFYYK